MYHCPVVHNHGNVTRPGQPFCHKAYHTQGVDTTMCGLALSTVTRFSKFNIVVNGKTG